MGLIYNIILHPPTYIVDVMQEYCFFPNISRQGPKLFSKPTLVLCAALVQFDSPKENSCHCPVARGFSFSIKSTIQKYIPILVDPDRLYHALYTLSYVCLAVFTLSPNCVHFKVFEIIDGWTPSFPYRK